MAEIAQTDAKREEKGIVNKRFISELTVAGMVFILVLSCSPYMRGDFELSLRNYETAIPYLQQCLFENPNHVPARNKLGFAYFKTRRLEQAIQEFEMVLEKNPGDLYATVYLGLTYLHNREFDKTIGIWKTYEGTGMPLIESEIKRQVNLLEKTETSGLSIISLAEIEMSINNAITEHEEIEKRAATMAGEGKSGESSDSSGSGSSGCG